MSQQDLGHGFPKFNSSYDSNRPCCVHCNQEKCLCSKTSHQHEEYKKIPWKEHDQEGSLYALGWQALLIKNWEVEKKFYNKEQIKFTRSDENKTIFLVSSCAIMTFALIWFVAIDRFLTEYEYPDFHLVLTRTCCQYFMAKIVVGEFNQGTLEMRYALWRPYEFSRPIWAAHFGLIQAFQSIFVTFAAMIMILSMDDMTTLITRFACLTILSQLDNFEADAILQEVLILDKEFSQPALHEYNLNIKDKAYSWKKNQKPILFDDKLALLKPDLEVYNMNFSKHYFNFFKSVPISPLLYVLDMKSFPWNLSWLWVFILSYFLPLATDNWNWDNFKENVFG